MKKYDIAVIGSCTGLMVVEAALAAGKKCAVIEASKFEGTCLTKGCIPSKMLVYPADIIREAQSAKRVGVSFANPELNWDMVGSRMWNQINHSIQIEESLQSTENLTVYKGFASFIDANKLHIEQNDGNSEEIFADKIVIAAGERTFTPPVKGLKEAGYVAPGIFFGDKFPKKALGQLNYYRRWRTWCGICAYILCIWYKSYNSRDTSEDTLYRRRDKRFYAKAV